MASTSSVFPESTDMTTDVQENVASTSHGVLPEPTDVTTSDMQENVASTSRVLPESTTEPDVQEDDSIWTDYLGLADSADQHVIKDWGKTVNVILVYVGIALNLLSQI